MSKIGLPKNFPGGKTADQSPEQPRRPATFKPFQFPSARELREKRSDNVMQQAAKLMRKVDHVNAEGKYKTTWELLDSHPCPEWWLDAKFGMFVDWGLYSIPAYAPTGYPDWYLFRMMEGPAGDTKDYHEKFWGEDFRQDDFIPLFTARDFDAEYLADVARAAGMKYVIPFLKHHDGFCLWDSSFTLRNSVVMGPKRDIAREWADACRKRGLKFGFYYSIDDWYYPVIEANGQLAVRAGIHGGRGPATGEWMKNEADWERRMLSGKIPVQDFFNEHINPVAIEFFDKYDPDIFWGDGDWILDAEVRNTRPMLAYFYNQAEGRKEVVSNDRLGCCRLFPTLGQQPDAKVHGDFVCSEGGYQPGQDRQINRPWEECHGLSHSFGYNWRETDKDVRSAKEVLHMLIEVVANGGNMLLITNLTPSGKLDPLMAERLKSVGAWLKVNGEAIYATRKWKQFREGRFLRFTQSKDGQFVYVICLEWPGKQLVVKSLRAEESSQVVILGVHEPLPWKQGDNGLVIEIPQSVAAKPPCDDAWVIKVKVQRS